MHRPTRIALALLVGPLLAMHAAAAEPAANAAAGVARPLQSRTVAEALRTLDGPGQRFVFSSQLVPDSLRVEAEPPPGDAVALARAILAPHGLGLEELQPGLFAVVRAAGASPSTPDVGTPAASSHVAERLAEVVVSASRYRIGDAPGGATAVDLVDAESLREQAGIGDDPLRALQSLPGVAHNGVSAASNVRGGEPSETLLLFDGFPLRRAYHLSSYQSLFSVIDAQLVNGAEVYTGGFPARYGNRMSAVFDMHSIDALAPPRHSLSLDFFNASLRASGGREESQASAVPQDWLVAGRVGTLKPLLQVFAPSVGQPSYADGYVRGGWGSVETLRITGNMLWGRDELGIERDERGEKGQLENRSRYFWLRADHEWDPSLQASLWLGQTRLETRRDGSADEPQISVGSVFDRRAARLSEARGRVVWQARRRHVFEAGFEASHEDAEYFYRANVTFDPDVAALFGRATSLARDFALTPQRRRGGVFLSYRWQATDFVTTEIGGRAQRLFTEGLSPDWVSEPRLGVRVQILPATRLQLSWGRFNQIDEINELPVEDGQTQFAAPQRSEHFIAGLEHQLGAHVALRLEAYEKRQTTPRARYENVLDAQTVLPEIAPDRVQVRPQRAKVDGVELSLSYDDHTLRVWGTGGWARAEDLIAGAWVARSWDQTWSVSGGAQWQGARWRFGGQAGLHRGWPQTVLANDATGQVVLGPRNGEHLPLYFQVDLRAQYSQPVPRGELLWTAELINATAHSNSCCTELVARDGRLAGRTSHWLPVVPSLGVRWNF